jgi:succinyl-CoA synthetase beta subunit
MARLHEYQGKAILAANGFKIPRGRAASVVNIKSRPLYPFTNLMV